MSVVELSLLPPTYLDIAIASQRFFSRHVVSMYTNDPLNFSPEESPTGASWTMPVSDPTMTWDVDGISLVYGLGMTPSIYPPPSTCQPDLFNPVTTRSFPICYGKTGEIMQDERLTFENSYVAAQSTSLSLGNNLDEFVPVSSNPPYTQVPLSLHPSIRCNNQNTCTFHARPTSDYGRSDDTSFSSLLFGDLNNSLGVESPSVPENCSMETTNWADLLDFSTLVPGTDNVPDIENPIAFDVAGSISQREYADVAASGIQTPQPTSVSVSTPVPGAMDAADGLIKPWQSSSASGRSGAKLG
ncbi:hypothetical protein IW261DRAFT_1574485 [Armillaria novae-zelandiae]|uniref:Uncharacterized protein n=1 Tax=Armillaria novae-zelandiae TaxID=153914 RepID=A0AA39TQ42_9AGAR|nr:hypothetical protein IW261DRAFT_1574485 [Armillaria novae-zelandiae]